MDSNKEEETVIQIVYVGPDGKGGWKEKLGPLLKVSSRRGVSQQAAFRYAVPM